MLTVSQISKMYADEVILSEISFTVNVGECLGLIGPNGCGKTTLLRILAGEERADGGRVRYTVAGARVGYLPQGLVLPPDITLEAYLAMRVGVWDAQALEAQVVAVTAALAAAPARQDLQAEYARVLEQLADAEAGAAAGAAMRMALGLGALAGETPVAALSGGQKTRLALAGVLLDQPQMLLLDEPTNHLDLEMLEWLEDWLVRFRGAAVVVSHDRAFLDAVATGMVEIDPHTHTARVYAGNYSDYLEAKVAEREHQRQAYSDQQEEIGALQQAARHMRGIGRFRKGGKADTNDKFAKGFFGNRAKGTIRRARQLEQRLERLLTDEKLEKPRQDWQIKLDFGAVPPSGRDVLAFSDLAIGYGETALAHGLAGQVHHGARVALVGPNGGGKTTLLRTLTGRLAPLAGQVRVGAAVRIGFMTQEQEELDLQVDALTMVRRWVAWPETETRAFLHQFLFTGDDVFVPLGQLSYGERARLALAGLVARGCNLLLLDEPLNHLDIPARARFEQALAGFAGTVLVVTHDRYFIAGYASEVWELEAGVLRAYSVENPLDTQ